MAKGLNCNIKHFHNQCNNKLFIPVIRNIVFLINAIVNYYDVKKYIFKYFEMP